MPIYATFEEERTWSEGSVYELPDAEEKDIVAMVRAAEEERRLEKSRQLQEIWDRGLALPAANLRAKRTRRVSFALRALSPPNAPPPPVPSLSVGLALFRISFQLTAFQVSRVPTSAAPCLRVHR